MSTVKHAAGPHPADVQNAVARRKLEEAAPALADALEGLVGMPDGPDRERAESVARDALRLAGRRP